MGRVTVSATVENIEDVIDLRRGRIEPAKVRRIEIEDALVDTGATMLSLSTSMIEKLGLERSCQRRARTTAGGREFWGWTPVRLSLLGRECNVDVAEVPDECSALIGHVPLELLDFVIDMNAHRLIGNPEHRGEHMMDMF